MIFCIVALIFAGGSYFSSLYIPAIRYTPIPIPITTPIPIHMRSKATTFLNGACTILLQLLSFFDEFVFVFIHLVIDTCS